jgi:hypothetical protein
MQPDMTKSATLSILSNGKTEGWPLGTVLTCLRNQQCVVARIPGRDSAILAGGADAPLSAPYGIAWDANKKHLWVADKRSSSLLRLSLCLSHVNENFVFSLQGLDRIEIGSCAAPCMLDIHPEFGLLVGCFGGESTRGSVIQYDGNDSCVLTPTALANRITHCCWLPDGGYCYVARGDWTLWYAENRKASPCALTVPGARRALSASSGELKHLRLRYVQGLCYSKTRNAVLVGDASLGAIYALDLKAKRYAVIAGRPTLSDSQLRANVKSGPSEVWLGPIRAVAENIAGDLLWLDGECGRIFRLNERNEIIDAGSALPDGESRQVGGCGMLAF